MNVALQPLDVLLLHEADAPTELSSAYGAVQLFAEASVRAELMELTQTTLLKLFDHGLIVVFRASLEDGYSADPADMPKLDRDQLADVFEFDRDPSNVPGEDDGVFFVQTDAGRAVFESIPPDSVPRVSGVVFRPWDADGSG